MINNPELIPSDIEGKEAYWQGVTDYIMDMQDKANRGEFFEGMED